MKVVHLVISDMFGAGRAATRISQAVSLCGVDSSVFILNPGLNSTSEQIHLSGTERIGRVVSKKRNEFMMRSYPVQGYFHCDHYGLDYSKHNFAKDADIIHIHWVNEGIYSSHFLSDIDKPVVSTFHDMWGFTGGCHYSGDCRRFTGQCGSCPCLGSSKETDLSAVIQNLRIKEYSSAQIQFVGCSKWITDEANSSRVLQESGKTCINIPNPINANWFHFRSQEESRKLLGIETKKKMILIGAVNLRDRRKGFHLLKEALALLDPEQYMLCMFGKMDSAGLEQFETCSFGSVYDDLHLSLIYNACDLFAAPSTQENLANTVMESLACGTPVAAFNIGGMPDMVIANENGYLAKPFDTTEFAECIRKCTDGTLSRKTISEDCLERFSLERIGKQYTDLYEKILLN